MDIQSLLNAYSDTPFVKRILYPNKYPIMFNDDGSYSTHLLSYMNHGNKYYVFPMLQYYGNQLKRYKNPRSAFEQAMISQNTIPFNSQQAADFFTKHYKDVWKQYIDTRRR